MSSVKLNCSEWFLRGQNFCCCIPVRAGVIIMSGLGILLSGGLSIALWYEVASTPDLTSKEQAVFILGVLMETFLFIVSIIGFAGAIVRKQLFIHIYAWAIYIHFLINVAVSIYLLVVVAQFSATAQMKLCTDAIHNDGAEQQCSDLLGTAKGIFVGVLIAVLLLELEGAIIVTRYLNRLKDQKRFTRQSRLMGTPGQGGYMLKGAHYSSLSDGNTELRGLSSPGMSKHTPHSRQSYAEYDPYEEVLGHRLSEDVTHLRNQSAYNDVVAAEQGYGGGSWSHQAISQEEKAKFEANDTPERAGSLARTSAELEEERRRETKSPAGPSTSLSREPTLPRYTLSNGDSGHSALR